MPLEKADLEQISTLIATAIGPVANSAKEAVQLAANLNAQFPGMSKRHAEDMGAEILKTVEAKFGGQKEKQKEAAPPNANEEVAKLRAELVERDKRALESEKGKLVAEVLQGVKFIDNDLAKISQDEIAKSLLRREDGSLYAKVKRKLDITGHEVEEEIGLKDFTTKYLAEHKGRLAADIKGGVGAGGSASFTGEKPTYKELMGNGALLNEWLTKDPQHVRKMETEAFEKSRSA